MSITLRQLRYLVAVVERSSFRKAAGMLNVSQPAMTAQIQLMEQIMGGLLLTRTRRGTVPTPLGEQAVARAKVILEDVESLMAMGRAAADRPLKLGMIPTVAPYLAPEVMELGADLAPAGLELNEIKTAELLAALREGTVDAALLALPEEPGGLGRDLEILPAFVEPFYALVSDGDPLAACPEVTLEMLRERPLLLLEDGHCLADQALALCGAAQQRAPIRSSSLSMVARLVARGKGVTLLPAIALPVETRRGDGTRAIPLAPPAPGRTLGLVWRKGGTGERCWRRLARALGNYAPKTAETSYPLAAE